MNETRQRLIRELTADLQPVTRPGRTGGTLALWLLLAGAYSVAIVLATGPLREGALEAIAAVPAFAVEMALAGLTAVLLARAALWTAIPDGATWFKHSRMALLAALAWVGLLAAAWIAEPAWSPSMLGKRDHCFSEALAFGMPSFALLLLAARRLMPLRPRATGALAGAAAAALPALLMQVACMYEPEHALEYHLSAIPALALAGFLVGPWALKRAPVAPRRQGATRH